MASCSTCGAAPRCGEPSAVAGLAGAAAMDPCGDQSGKAPASAVSVDCCASIQPTKASTMATGNFISDAGARSNADADTLRSVADSCRLLSPLS